MKILPVFVLALAALLSSCGEQSDPQPKAPVVTAPTSTQPTILGTWFLMDAVYSRQTTAAAPQVFGAMFPYNHTTTFIFRADGTAAFSPGSERLTSPSVGQPASGRYTLTGTLLSWETTPPQSFTVVSLTLERLVLDRRTVDTFGSILTERRGYTKGL